MSDRSRSSFRAKTQALQVYLQNAPHPKNVFAIFFLQLFSTRVELSSHGVVVFFFSSSVKIDRNIHACVYMCVHLGPPGRPQCALAFGIWQDLKKNVCFTIPRHFLNKFS